MFSHAVRVAVRSQEATAAHLGRDGVIRQVHCSDLWLKRGVDRAAGVGDRGVQPLRRVVVIVRQECVRACVRACVISLMYICKRVTVLMMCVHIVITTTTTTTTTDLRRRAVLRTDVGVRE